MVEHTADGVAKLPGKCHKTVPFDRPSTTLEYKSLNGPVEPVEADQQSKKKVTDVSRYLQCSVVDQL